MKYIMGICNVFALVLLSIMMNITSKELEALRADYQANVNKYKTENAAEVAYVANLYHMGDWSTILADMLSVQQGTSFSQESRVNAVQKTGVAVSFEETNCSYLMAFEDDIAAMVVPYVIASNADSSLLIDMRLKEGYLINKATNATEALGTEEDVLRAYRTVAGLPVSTKPDVIKNHMIMARAKMFNEIVYNAMGISGYFEKDAIYIPAYSNIVPGINTIENQTILVLNGADRSNNTSTTLAGFTKVTKRLLCTISGPGGTFYCYNDQIPNNYVLVNIYQNEREASTHDGCIGQFYFDKE